MLTYILKFLIGAFSQWKEDYANVGHVNFDNVQSHTSKVIYSEHYQ